LVGDVLAAPDGILLGAGEDRDRLDLFRVRWERPVGRAVGA
jgi:hypothetical protein